MNLSKIKLAIKLLGFFSLFTLLIASITVFLLLLSNRPQTYAKQLINYYLSSDLGINASFQSIQGNLYDSITIDNITCFDSHDPNNNKILYIHSASIRYNLFNDFLKIFIFV